MKDAPPAHGLHQITIETKTPSKWMFVDLDGHVWRSDGKAFTSASDEELERIRSVVVRLLSQRTRRATARAKSPSRKESR